MKTQIFAFVTVVLGLSSFGQALAADKIDPGVYTRLYGHKCSVRQWEFGGDSYPITSAEAQDIAALSAKGKINVDAFLSRYDSDACDYNSARQFGIEVKKEGIDLAAYNKLFNRTCTPKGAYCDPDFGCDHVYIDDASAKDIAKKVAKEQIDLTAFLNAYDHTCDFENAQVVGSFKVMNRSVSSDVSASSSSAQFDGSRKKLSVPATSNAGAMKSKTDAAGRAN